MSIWCIVSNLPIKQLRYWTLSFWRLLLWYAFFFFAFSPTVAFVWCSFSPLMRRHSFCPWNLFDVLLFWHLNWLTGQRSQGIIVTSLEGKEDAKALASHLLRVTTRTPEGNVQPAEPRRTCRGRYTSLGEQDCFFFTIVSLLHNQQTLMFSSSLQQCQQYKKLMHLSQTIFINIVSI